MSAIDFNSEAAATYVETVRLAHKFGVANRLYHRPAAHRAEAEQAAAVRRHVERTTVGYVASSPEAQGLALAGSSPEEAPACAECGATQDLYVRRIVWLGIGQRATFYRCRGGCHRATEQE